MEDLVVKFVQIVESYPCLYNNTLQEYSRKDVIGKAWTEIAQQMHWSVADCKEKWKNVRNNFVRSLKGPPSGSSSKPKKPYYLHDNLQFVLPYVRPIQHLENNTTNILLPDEDIMMKTEEIVLNEQDAPNSVSQSPESTLQTECNTEPKKKKKSNRRDDDIAGAVLRIVKERQAKKGRIEGRRLFLMSLLSDVEKMTEEDYLEFRIYCLMGVRKFVGSSAKNNNLHLNDPLSFYPSSSSSVVSTPALSPNNVPLNQPFVIYNNDHKQNFDENVAFDFDKQQ